MTYSMNNDNKVTITPVKVKYFQDFLSAYLPTAFSYCEYYSCSVIKNQVADMEQNEYITLKKLALLSAQNVLEIMSNILTKYEKKDTAYTQIKTLHDALENALKDWPNDTLFHPLLFLQHKKNDPTTIILRDPNPPTSPKKTYDKHKYSFKKQKLVQNGR